MPRRQSNLDVTQLAKLIGDAATGQGPKPEPPVEREKNPHAVAMGKLGGKKGGDARAAKLSAEERKGIARKAAEGRWGKKAGV